MSVKPLIFKPLVQRLTGGANFALDELVFVAFDTETTGLKPGAAHLVELSGVKFTARAEVLSTFSALINPGTPIPEEATAIHGISDEMVAAEPPVAEVLPGFLKWATDPEAKGQDETVLMAHNAGFDLSFIASAITTMTVEAPGNIVLDTLNLSRRLVDDSANHQLRTLIEYFALESETYHRALADSHHVKNLFLNLLKRLPAGSQLKELITIGGKFHLHDYLSQDHGADDSEFAQAISKALGLGKKIKIEYAGARRSQRVLTPRSLQSSSGYQYLNAYCHQALADRVFRLDKIISVEVLDGQHG